jgi:hypothetical protein
MIVANAATLLGAHSLLQKIKTGKPSVDVVLFLLLRILLISGAVILAGLVGLLTPLALGLAGAAALAVLLARGAQRSLPRPMPLPWNRWLVAGAVLILIRLLLQVWLFAPYTDDALSYHLPKIAEWIRAGGFTREMGSSPRATLPAGFEIVETWWLLFLHHDVLIEMAGLEFLALACAAVYALGRELGWSPSCALGSAILFGMTPGLHLEATSALNDVAAAALVLATAVLIVARAAPSLILVAVALGAGIKPTYVYALPGLALLYGMSRREATLRPGCPWAARGASMLALLAGGFWYVRNVLWFGNPVYPMGTPQGAQIQQFGPSLSSLRENVLALIDLRVYDFVSAPGALHTGNANWGAVAFACGFPALIVVLREEPRLRRLATALLFSLLCVFTLVTLDPWNVRFIQFFPALPALALARVATRHRLLAGLAVIALFLEFISTTLPSEISRPKLASLASQDWSGRSTRPAEPSVAKGVPIGLFSDEGGNPYWLYDPDFSRRVVYLRESTLEGLLTTLDREAVTVFYVAVKTDQSNPLFEEGVRKQALQPFRDGFGRGYRRVR